MGIDVGPGISIGSGITFAGDFVPSVTLVYNLDAANYSALPVNGSTVAGTGGGGFNQLRLFSRSSGTEVQTGNIGLVKAYSGVFTTADVQGLYAQYKTRFGY